jgi:hypothetical protein
MPERGTRGAYRKEDRVQLPAELQKELVEKAAAKYGNCQELAKHLNIPKSSVHYYRIGRLTIPESVLKSLLGIANDESLRERIKAARVTKDRMWAIEYAKSVFIESCKDRVTLPAREDLARNDELRRKAAGIVSYLLAEGSIWMQKEKWGEYAANITLHEQETGMYNHFRTLCREVFRYDIGPPQRPGNEARAIRGFIYSRFVAEWLIENGVPVGDKAQAGPKLPEWVMNSDDKGTWIAALQPLCDGEGCVRDYGRFSFTQSRHSDLDLDTLPRDIGAPRGGRTLGMGRLSVKMVYGMPAIDYCMMTARSELLDDSSLLLIGLGLRPRIRLNSLYLKDDGFWSCNWAVNFPRSDARELLRMGLVRDDLKRHALEVAVSLDRDDAKLYIQRTGP